MDKKKLPLVLLFKKDLLSRLWKSANLILVLVDSKNQQDRFPKYVKLAANKNRSTLVIRGTWRLGLGRLRKLKSPVKGENTIKFWPTHKQVRRRGQFTESAHKGESPIASKTNCEITNWGFKSATCFYISTYIMGAPDAISIVFDMGPRWSVDTLPFNASNTSPMEDT
jgi:hypothetical protein